MKAAHIDNYDRLFAKVLVGLRRKVAPGCEYGNSGRSSYERSSCRNRRKTAGRRLLLRGSVSALRDCVVWRFGRSGAAKTVARAVGFGVSCLFGAAISAGGFCAHNDGR